MSSTVKSRVLAVVVVAVIVITAAAVYFTRGASHPTEQSSLVSPADLRARDAFRASWQALTAQSQAKNIGAQVPVTGNASAAGQVVSDSSIAKADQEQRVINAYSARLTGLANQPSSMANRANEAASARLNGLANQQMAVLERINTAYSARLIGIASLKAGMSPRALDADTARWEAMARYYQSMPGK